jgi:hypothetical protein
MTTPLSKLPRKPIQDVLGGLKAESPGASKEYASKLIAQAKEYGLGMRDYLTLAIDVRASNDNGQFGRDGDLLSGYEAALSFLNLPVKDDFKNGVSLELASDSFQTFPGTRAMFPEVVDDMVRWKYRQQNFENIDALIGSRRTISGNEMISTIVDDDANDYQVVKAIAEGARIPIKTIRTTEQGVKFYKHGGGYRTTYEFERRARIDLLTPYAVRMQRETEMSKVRWGTLVLLNGDGVNPAATEVDQSSYDTAVGTNATDGKLSYKHFMHWVIDRAKAGTPIDTVIGDWDAYVQWLFLFAAPTINANMTDAQALAAAGFQITGVPVLTGVINFALSSAAPAGKLIGFSRGDTLEELTEAGSLIEESERSIQNQTITYVKTESSGFKLAFPDTRGVYDYGN